MKALALDTKEAGHLREQVPAVVPTCEEKNVSSIAQTADAVEVAVVAALAAAPVGSTADDNLGTWTKQPDGQWTFEDGPDPRPAEFVAKMAVGELVIGAPLQRVRLPERVVEPNLARFQALVDAHPDALVVGAPDPRVDTPCPAWCAEAVIVDDRHPHRPGLHEVRPDRYTPEHRSAPVRVPLYGMLTASSAFEVQPGALLLRLTQRANSRYSRAPIIDLAVTRKRRDEQVMDTLEIASISVSEARMLRDTLDAVIALADPDGEFEAAAR